MSKEIKEVIDTDDDFNILDVFNEQSTSTSLPAGVHENVKLVSVNTKRRKDNQGNLIKKQLFLKFKKFDKEGEDIGESDVSFFLVDPSRDMAIDNLHSFISQVREILSVFYTTEEISAKFDPLAVLYDAEKDAGDEDATAQDFLFGSIKKARLKKSSSFTAVEEAICEQFGNMVEGKTGFESEGFRFKLEESKDAKYIQIPRYSTFIERTSVSKANSTLYNN